MILSNADMSNSFELEEGKVNTLVMENPLFYRNTVINMREQLNGGDEKFFLLNNGKKEDFGKNTELITDIFALKFDTKQINGKIMQAVSAETAFSEDEIFDIVTRLNTFASSLASKMNFSVSFKEMTDINGILKLFDFFLETADLSFYEKITEYTDVCASLLGKKLFVFLNLKSALSDMEIEEFFKNAEYKKLRILLLENKTDGKIFNNEKVTVIDRDLCEIT